FATAARTIPYGTRYSSMKRKAILMPMPANHGPYHRKGSPGGPGCRVTSLPVKLKQSDGQPISATFLDADSSASELELLRTVASGLGIQWGQDEFGWWAVIPDRP